MTDALLNIAYGFGAFMIGAFMVLVPAAFVYHAWKFYDTFRAWAFVVFILGAALGVTLDKAQAAGITDAQADVMGFIAVEAVAVQKCNLPQRPDMFAGLQKAGMTIQDLTGADGKLAPVMAVTIQHVHNRYIDHPKEFCAFVAGARTR